MFNTFPVNTIQADIKNSDKRLWKLVMMHSYDGGQTWGSPQQLPVDDIFTGQQYDPCPSYCAIGKYFNFV